MPSDSSMFHVMKLLNTAVDEIRCEEQRILEDLQLKKKELMQKLFSRELRFKNKNETTFPEWEEKNLGEIAKKISCLVCIKIWQKITIVIIV
jgi:hypothetical protein